MAPAVVFVFLRARHWNYAVLLAWFAAVVGAGVLTLDPPAWPRLAAMLPAAALLVAVLLDALWALGERLLRSRLVAAAGVVGLLGVIAAINFQIQYADYPALIREGPWMGATLVGDFLAGRPDASHATLLSDGSFDIRYDTVRFLAPQAAAGCTIMPGQPWSSCPTLRSTRVFVLLPGVLGALSRLQREFPGGKTIEVGTYSGGTSRILAYVVRGSGSPGT
jgi:hypothetical protein